MRRRARLIILLPLLAALSACVSSRPRIADIPAGHRPPASTDEAGLWLAMDKVENQIRTSGNLVRGKALNSYVKGIVCKLAGARCPDIRVYILRRPHFNASMAPNGVMQVWTGLLLRTRNEAQLATVLGHEIGHFLKRHSLQQWRDATATTDALMVVQMAMGAAGVGQFGNLAGLMAIGGLLAFGRDHEREADRVGLEMIAKAGYDPSEAAKVWDQLIREGDAALDKTRPPFFFSTHPPSKERSASLKKLASAAIRRGGAGDKGRARFREVIAPLRAAYLRDDQHLREFSRSLELIAMLIEDGAGRGELEYFRGELHRLRGEDGDREKALGAYGAALAGGGAPPEAHRSLGLMHLKSKDRARARAAFTAYLQAVPEAEDREMIRALIEPGG